MILHLEVYQHSVKCQLSDYIFRRCVARLTDVARTSKLYQKVGRRQNCKYDKLSEATPKTMHDHGAKFNTNQKKSIINTAYVLSEFSTFVYISVCQSLTVQAKQASNRRLLDATIQKLLAVVCSWPTSIYMLSVFK